MNNQELYQIAFNTIHHKNIKCFGTAGHVALETNNGSIFTGICIDLPCAIGSCAEQSAIAEMIKNNETAIKRIIAVFEDGSILPPCGRCREFIAQVDDRNIQTQIVMPEMTDMLLQDLLPERWDNKWNCKK